MPAPTTKTLSPAELAKLETAFATDPSSEAYRPLAEAYLAMGRYMEAMVVCKKGVKAHPAVADPRVLLARVYAEQGKDKKALEEVQGALQVAPADKVALRLIAMLQLRGGETDAGKANLLKAFEADPADQDTLAAMAQHKVEPPKKAAPPPPQQLPPQSGGNGAQAGPPVLQPASPSNIQVAPDLEAQHLARPAQQPQAQARPASQPVRSSAGQLRPVQARPSAPPQRRRVAEHHDDEESRSDAYELSEVSRRRKKPGSGAAKALFFLLIFAVPVAAGAYYGIGQWKAKQKREVTRLLREANDAFKSDTFASYKLACTYAEKALDMDPESTLAHSYLAYAYTVRWGEHERDDTIRGRAEEHLAEAKKGKADERAANFYAADALFKYYSGKGADAQKDLDELVKKLEGEGKRPGLLQLTLGIIDMNLGDLEGAKDALERAQASASDDPRVYVALGNLHRRRGNDVAALNAFNSALKYTRNSHPEGLAGTALLILDQENPGAGYITASKYLKTLLESDPPPSPRQLAQGHFAKALLISRVSTDIGLYSSKEFQKQLEDGTGVSGDKDKARSEMQKEEEAGLALDRNNPDLLVIRGKRLAFENNLDGAAAEINKAINMNWTMANYHVELAKVLMRKEGGEKAAEDSVRKALSIVPNSPKLKSLLGQLLYKQKKVDDATKALEDAVKDLKTKNPEARYLLGRIYRDDKKDYARAADMLEQAAKDYYSDPTMAANTYNDLAATYEAKGEKDRAKVNFEKALNADKDFAPAYCAYVRYLARNPDAKDKDLPKRLAEQYLKLEPKGECAADMQKVGTPG